MSKRTPRESVIEPNFCSDGRFVREAYLHQVVATEPRQQAVPIAILTPGRRLLAVAATVGGQSCLGGLAIGMRADPRLSIRGEESVNIEARCW
jgi:hypothetical protein